MQLKYTYNSVFPGLQLRAPLPVYYHGANLKGFNGMEKDDEMKGKGNSYDFGARIYDSRLGRWLSRDPKENVFASQSPYNYVYNNPILSYDFEGESGIATVKGKTITISATFYFYDASGKEQLKHSTSRKITRQMQKQWNKANGKVTIDGKTYKVKFSFTAETISKEEAKEKADNLQDGVGIIGIIDGSTKNQMGVETGTGKMTDDHDVQSQAHELTHFFGMSSHPEVEGEERLLYWDDELGKNAERGDLMIAVPSNTKDKDGKIMDLDYSKRKVTQGDIDRIGLDKVLVDVNGKIKSSGVVGTTKQGSNNKGTIYNGSGEAEYKGTMTIEEFSKWYLSQPKPN